MRHPIIETQISSKDGDFFGKIPLTLKKEFPHTYLRSEYK